MDKGMDGSMGVSPRKAMGMGKADSGAASVDKYKPGMMHPDAKMGTAAKSEMKDGDRGIGMPVMHSKGKLPAQASPDHGPHMDSWSRSGKA